jgi:hypothetical protein
MWRGELSMTAHMRPVLVRLRDECLAHGHGDPLYMELRRAAADEICRLNDLFDYSAMIVKGCVAYEQCSRERAGAEEMKWHFKYWWARLPSKNTRTEEVSNQDSLTAERFTGAKTFKVDYHNVGAEFYTDDYV